MIIAGILKNCCYIPPSSGDNEKAHGSANLLSRDASASLPVDYSSHSITIKVDQVTITGCDL